MCQTMLMALVQVQVQAASSQVAGVLALVQVQAASSQVVGALALVQVLGASTQVAGVLVLALALALALAPAQGVHRISATIISASRQSSLVAVQA
jgi:hypothetical protein